MLILQTSYT